MRNDGDPSCSGLPAEPVNHDMGINGCWDRLGSSQDTFLGFSYSYFDDLQYTVPCRSFLPALPRLKHQAFKRDPARVPAIRCKDRSQRTQNKYTFQWVTEVHRVE